MISAYLLIVDCICPPQLLLLTVHNTLTHYPPCTPSLSITHSLTHHPQSYRQKIDEAPTPYRYLSESDESDADCRKMRTSSKDSSGSEGHKHAHVMFSNHLNDTIPTKKTTTAAAAASSSSNMISDSWEAVNAKLQYEKHLQDLNDRNNNNSNNDDDNDNDASASHHDVLMDRHNQRREFYSSSCGSSNSSSSNNSSSHYDSGSHPVEVSMSHKPPHRSKQPSFQLPNKGALRIDDIQTNFGEIMNPAPAAFSPQFTRKHYRSNDRLNTSISSNAGGDGDNESISTIQQDTESSTTSSHHHNHHHPHHHNQPVRPKTVFIPVIASVTCDRDADYDDNNNSTADAERTHGDGDDVDDKVSNTINGKHSNDKSKFLNKRAVHYNEYKVLQAMRAKMKAEEEEEEEDDEY